jgi:hypothetical protein
MLILGSVLLILGWAGHRIGRRCITSKSQIACSRIRRSSESVVEITSGGPRSWSRKAEASDPVHLVVAAGESHPGDP